MQLVSDPHGNQRREHFGRGAEIAAKHFKPSGLDLIQLDHGWQQGDICGDWTPNEAFPHGMKWLSEQLQSRYG